MLIRESCMIIYIKAKNLMKGQTTTKQTKRNALQSFLQSNATPAPTSQVLTESSAKSELVNEQAFEQYQQQFTNCNVCGTDLDPAKLKKCQFCSMPACNDHIRKRRKKKTKWQKICDNCEDKYLYDVFMKLESKADEALSVEEEITALKHQNFKKEVEIRQEKRREIGFKTMSLKERQEIQVTKITDAENRLMSLQHQVQSAGLAVQQLETFVHRVSAAFKDNNEESWNILSEQNNRMAKELTKLQKKIHEIKGSIDHREKQIESAFEVWQQKQFKKKLESEERAAAEKKKECQIF